MTSIPDPTPEHELLRRTVRRFVEEELRPRTHEFDSMGKLDRALFPRMAELGLLGLRYDPAHGGAGLDWSYSRVLYEELGRCDNLGVATGIMVHTDMATPSLHRFGTEELKQRYLVPSIAGEQVSAIAVTEPDAGSDVARIRTRAVRDGDDWVLNGSKMYITNAATADWLCLLAVTDPEAGHNGFSQIIVPTDTAGVSFELLDKIGGYGSDTGIFYLEDARVPVANTIGQEGMGFAQQMMQFQDERLCLCIMVVASANLVWEDTRSWAQQRELFGKPLAKMQNTQFKMVEGKTRLTASEHLIQACVDRLVAGEDATELVSMAKLFCCRVAREVTDECLQLHGGSGFMTESMAGRAWVATRISSVGGGSDETMMHYLGRRLGF